MSVSRKDIPTCPVDAALRVIDGRWKGTILWRIAEGPQRPSELLRSIPGITERMLLRHLGELTTDGILLRERHSAVPPVVSYRLSPYGLTLVPVVQGICDWGRVQLQRVAAETSTTPDPDRL